MNVNAAGMTDIPITSSTAPAKDSKKRDTEAPDAGFQKVMDQFADRKDSKSEKPKDNEYVDPRTLTAHLKSEDDKKAEDARLKAMMAQAEPAAVLVVTPEMLMEVVGDNGQDGMVTAIDPSLNNQSSDPAENLSDQEMMAAAGPPSQDTAMDQTQSAAPALEGYAQDTMQGTDSVLLSEQLSAQKDSVKTLNYDNDLSNVSKTLTEFRNQQAADQTVMRSPVAGQENQPVEEAFYSTESQIDGSDSSHKEMIFETTDENQNRNQGNNSTGMITENQSGEALQNAQQLWSESAGRQTTVVSDTVSVSGQMETQPIARNSQPAVQPLSSDIAEQSAVGDQAAKAASQTSTAGEQESGFADMLKHQSTFAAARNSASDSEAVSGKMKPPTLDETQASLEELKKNAEAKGVNLMDRMTEARLMNGAKVQTLNQAPGFNGANVVSQLKDGLEMGMKNQLKEFTIHLKPEGLGEVVINMVSQDGKLTVNIGASNADTQKLINSQMMSLKEMLEPLHAEVGQVYQSSQESTGFLSYGQNMSENQRQQAGRYQGQPGYGTYTMEDEEILTEAEYMTVQSRMARLYTYV